MKTFETFLRWRLTYLKMAFATVAMIGVLHLSAATSDAVDWTRFRGDGGTGFLPSAELPAEISEANVVWKTDLPGKGPSSPIVVGDKVFLTASGGLDQEWMSVICFDAKSGERQWIRKFWPTGRPNCHPDSSNAAPSPVTDGEHVYAFFSSNDLVCLDFDGNLKWFRGLAHDYPKAGNDTGMASSPAIFGEAIFVQVENQADSFAVAIDRKTGETLWRIKRNPAVCWASPMVVPGNGAHPDMVILQSRGAVTGNRVDTGEELWKIEGDVHTTSSPCYRNGVAYIPIDGMTALKFDSEGKAEKLWNVSGMRPAGASAVVDDNHIYIRTGNGVVSCYDSSDGQQKWKLRVGKSQVWSSPILTSKYMYCFDFDGSAHVIKLGDEPEVVSDAQLSKVFQCTPAVGDGNSEKGNAIYVRSNSKLMKIGNK